MTRNDPRSSRRSLLQGAAGLAVAQLATLPANAASGATAAAPSGVSAAAPAGPAPARPAGKAGDFDFLAGEWRIQHRRLKSAGGSDWDEFEGEATCWSILAGVGSIEELRIPARNFSGVGIRLLDVEQKIWNDFWVNAKSGVLTTPGLTGVFENGAGIFEAEEKDGDQPILVRGVWDRITPGSCRWYQAISRDAGRTWQENWVMDWRRAPSVAGHRP